LRKGKAMSENDRIEKLEQRVTELENYLHTVPIPVADAVEAKLAALEQRVQAIEEKKTIDTNQPVRIIP
jgi:polyhydroxyalkanoate synthesis regulator phasin